MIGPTEKFADLIDHDRNASRMLADEDPCDMPSASDIIREAAVAMVNAELVQGPGEMVGMYLLFDGKDGTRMRLAHSLVYTRCRPDEVLVAVRQHMAWIARLGPGVVWFLDPPAHVIRDDGKLAIWQDPTEVCLRTIYGHDAQAVPDV